MFEDKVIVSQLMTKNVVVANPSNKISQVLAFFTETNITHLPVAENDRLLGIISIKDLLKFISKGLQAGTSVSMESLDSTFSLDAIMTKDPITLSPSDDVEKARELLSTGKFSALPVVDNGDILGIISIKDVVRFDNTL
jgi:CBS domain-containing protein